MSNRSQARANTSVSERTAPSHLRLVKAPRGAGRNIEAATMGVTVAVEEAHKRGAMSVFDAKHLSAAERQHYVRLCASEWGINEWFRGESPRDMEETTRNPRDEMSQFDNVDFLSIR